MTAFLKKYWRRITLETALVLAFALALFAVLAISTPDGQGADMAFWNLDNARFIAAQALPLTLGSLGMALVLLVGGIDLSAGACAVLAGVLAAVLLQKGTPAGPALGFALLAGAVIGAFNGTLAGFSRKALSPWAITLGTFAIIWGAARWIGGDAPVSIPAGSGMMGTLRGLNLAPGLLLVLALTGAFALLLRATVFGRHLRAIGSNEEAARLCGVRVRLTKWLAYTAGGVFFAAAGLAAMAVSGEASFRAGLGLEIAFLAAAMLGGVKLGGGSGGVFCAFIGALAIATLQNAVQQAGWPVPFQEMGMGCLLVLAVAVNWLRYEKGT